MQKERERESFEEGKKRKIKRAKWSGAVYFDAVSVDGLSL